MQIPNSVIIIDDNPISSSISEMVVKMAWENIKVDSFSHAEEGFAFIANSEDYYTTGYILLILNIDIQNGMSGWQLLEYFDALDSSIKNNIKIITLSALFNKNNRKRAFENKQVVEYLVKPFTPSRLLAALSGKKFAGPAFEKHNA